MNGKRIGLSGENVGYFLRAGSTVTADVGALRRPGETKFRAVLEEP